MSDTVKRDERFTMLEAKGPNRPLPGPPRRAVDLAAGERFTMLEAKGRTRETGGEVGSEGAAFADATIPTAGELAQMPRWAQVALAARCARRVFPLFGFWWPTAPLTDAVTFRWVIEQAEQLAASGGTSNPRLTSAGAILCAAYVCDATHSAARNRDWATELSRAVPMAIQIPAIPDHLTGQLLRSAVENAVTGIAQAYSRTPQEFSVEKQRWTPVTRADFDRLAVLARAEGWTDDTPVPLAAFGPLWPDGPPEGWPPETPVLSGPDNKSLAGILADLARRVVDQPSPDEAESKRLIMVAGAA